jgi:molecular chaperone DnaK (HSP70)
MRLGIDFGTTRTVVAAALDGRYPIASFKTPGGYSEFLPGLAAPFGSELLFGWDAAAAQIEKVRSIKRIISSLASGDRVAALGSRVDALGLVTAFVEHLREQLLEHTNLGIVRGEPLEAMIAVPANASSRQRYITIEAFRRAGFDVVGVINEPTAAAVEFAHRHAAVLGPRSPKRYVVVYDLGGGTFDSAAVSLQGRHFELLEAEGIAELGGDDFDDAILTLALEASAERRVDPSLRPALLEACREAKESLRSTSRRLLVDLGTILPGFEPVMLDAERVYERSAPLVERTLRCVESVFASLTEHGIDPNNPRELGALYLVGGAVAFPAVQRRLRSAYGRKLELAPQPHAATAIGLAIAADRDAGVLVREAATRHFGVWREASEGTEQVFDPILTKGSLPTTDGTIRVERAYRPAHSIGHLRFMECTRVGRDGEPAGDLTPCGDILFPYDPTLADREYLQATDVPRRSDLGAEEIVESYSYDVDGSVAVTIENRTHGYRRRYVVGASG